MKKYFGVLLAGMALCASAAMEASSPDLQTVAHVDLERYAGKWYELARYPNRFERQCERDVIAEYSLKKDGAIRVVNSCVTGQGKSTQSEGTAKVVDDATHAKLKVTFFWPFYGNYWVIDLGTEYQYAVVGEPSRKYLWILSRTPAIPDAVYQGIAARLAEQKYDPAKLVKTEQSEAPAK